MTKPFHEFCTLVFGPAFTSGQVAEALQVSKETVRSWLKTDDMPKGRSILLFVMRMQKAADLVEIQNFTEEEIENIINRSHLVQKGPKT